MYFVAEIKYLWDEWEKIFKEHKWENYKPRGNINTIWKDIKYVCHEYDKKCF